MLAQMLPNEIFAFLLVIARIGAGVMLLPGIGETYVSVRVRLALAVSLSLVLFPLVREIMPALPGQPLQLIGLIGTEVIHGVFIGLATRLLLSSLHVAGTVIAFQSSLAYAQTVDPNQGSQGVLVASLLTLLGVVLIFVTGLHTVLIAALYDSYALFPVGELPPADDFAALVTRIVAAAFALGIKMAAPFIVYGLVFYVGLGLLQRLTPQIQLFFIAMPAQLMLAFLVLAVVLSAVLMVFLDQFETSASLLLRPV